VFQGSLSTLTPNKKKTQDLNRLRGIIIIPNSNLPQNKKKKPPVTEGDRTAPLLLSDEGQDPKTITI